MLGTISSIVGVFVFLVGAIWWLLQWAAKPSGQQLLKTVDALTPGDLAKYIAVATEASAPGRLEPLQNADALMTYFEKTKNVDGQKAVSVVVSAIFAQPEVK